MTSKYALRFVALGYLALLLGIPVALVFINAFQDGFAAAWDAVTTPEAQSYIDHQMKRLGVPRLLARAGANDGDVVWVANFSFEYQADV